MTRNKTELLDRAGVIASTACAVHCLAMPLIIGLFAAYGAARLDSPVVEWIALAVSFLIGLAGLFPSYRRRHRRKCCLAFFVGGISVLTAAQIFLDGHRNAETAGVCAGAVLISTAHLLNRRFCRSCTSCHSQLRGRKA